MRTWLTEMAWSVSARSGSPAVCMICFGIRWKWWANTYSTAHVFVHRYEINSLEISKWTRASISVWDVQYGHYGYSLILFVPHYKFVHVMSGGLCHTIGLATWTPYQLRSQQHPQWVNGLLQSKTENYYVQYWWFKTGSAMLTILHF